MQAYFFFTKGMLPNPGGWLEQSEKFLAAMQIIDMEIKKMEIDKLEKNRKKHASKKQNP